MNNYELFDGLRKLTTKAQKFELDANKLSELFPERGLNSQPVIYCPNRGYLSNLHKLGWLLGKEIHVISPFNVHHLQVVDEGYGAPSGGDIDSYFVDAGLLEWRTQLEGHQEFKYRVFPSIYLDLEKRWDSSEEWNDIVSSRIARSNLNLPVALPDIFAQVESAHRSTVEVPGLIIRDRELLGKIQNDYPIASDELRKLLVDSHRLATTRAAEGTPQNEVLAELLESVVNPGVRKIQLEYKEMLKSQAIKVAAESVGLSLPLVFSFADDIGALVSKLLAAGIGLKLAQTLVELRSNLITTKKQPFFAAMKLSLGNSRKA